MNSAMGYTEGAEVPEDKTETLYQLWERNNLPVRIHGATEYLFNAYKYGASGHCSPLKKAFPEYFVDPWTVFPKKP